MSYRSAGRPEVAMHLIESALVNSGTSRLPMNLAAVRAVPAASWVRANTAHAHPHSTDPAITTRAQLTGFDMGNRTNQAAVVSANPARPRPVVAPLRLRISPCSRGPLTNRRPTQCSFGRS